MPAVLVGGTLNSLGVVRSLALAKVPVYVLETTRRCAAAWSRHCRFVHTPTLKGDTLVDKLVELAADLGCRPVLLLTSDDGVVTVSAHRDRLVSRYHMTLPSPQVVDALVEKAAFQRLAEREGFAVPRGVVIDGEADLNRLDALSPPIIIKPTDKTLVLAGAVDRAGRAQTVTDAKILARRMLLGAPHLIAQEWVEGPDTEIFFTLFSCDLAGNLIGFFSGRKLACSPPAIGSTAVCAAAPEVADGLYERTLRFIQRTEYRGLGSLEFKRESRNGQFFIIEPTVGRTDWQEEIATLCGVNLPLLTYWAALGRTERLGCDRGGRPVAWRSSGEFRASSRIAPGVRVVDGYFRWNDPIPAAYYYGYERLLSRFWRRAIGLLRIPFKLIQREE